MKIIASQQQSAFYQPQTICRSTSSNSSVNTPGNGQSTSGTTSSGVIQKVGEVAGTVLNGPNLLWNLVARNLGLPQMTTQGAAVTLALTGNANRVGQISQNSV